MIVTHSPAFQAQVLSTPNAAALFKVRVDDALVRKIGGLEGHDGRESVRGFYGLRDSNGVESWAPMALIYQGRSWTGQDEFTQVLPQIPAGSSVIGAAFCVDINRTIPVWLQSSGANFLLQTNPLLPVLTTKRGAGVEVSQTATQRNVSGSNTFYRDYTQDFAYEDRENIFGGAASIAMQGSAAPTTKANADAAAACQGLAMSVTLMLSSASRWAARASLAVSSRAT
jgi:hypothetical protein